MALTRKTQKHSNSRAKQAHGLPFHAFWSGSLSFGLVNVRVLVFPASRHAGIHLRLMSPEGSFLERRFFCPRDDKEVSGDEIVRGYELDDGSYITVEDKELEALEPQKSQEISLQEFVPISDLPSIVFERGYYLTPQKEAMKAYRLLAEVMERTGRAGIATFVMRDREYLVAIFARAGILCAETLRFHDETRTPVEIGLPEFAPPPRARVSAFEKAIDALSAKAMPKGELDDEDDQKLMAIIRNKLKSGKDLIRLDPEAKDGALEDEDGSDVDLLETIRLSLREGTRSGGARRNPAEPSQNGRATHVEPALASRKSTRARPRRRSSKGRASHSG